MPTVTIRTTEEVEQALDALVAEGVSRSEAIRQAILAAHQQQRHARLRTEAEALRNDPDDNAESLRVAEEMEELRAW